MFDLGESRAFGFDTDLEKRDIKLALPWWMLSVCPASWITWVRGVLGEGVSGARPPARRVEKMPSRGDLMGVSTDGVAISAYDAFRGDVAVCWHIVSQYFSTHSDGMLGTYRWPS